MTPRRPTLVPGAALLLALAMLGGVGCRAAPPDPAAEGPIRVAGDVLHPTAWTAERLLERFPDQVRVVRHASKSGDVHALKAVPIAALLEASEPAADPDRKNPELAMVVVARARDGYTVTYAYEEVVPFRAEPTLFLAFAEEDGPLPERFAPARIVWLGPTNPSRAPHAIVSLEVVDLARSSSPRASTP